MGGLEWMCWEGFLEAEVTELGLLGCGRRHDQARLMGRQLRLKEKSREREEHQKQGL